MSLLNNLNKATNSADGNVFAYMQDLEREEECLREEIGTGRYGCRCQQCSEDLIDQSDREARL